MAELDKNPTNYSASESLTVSNTSVGLTEATFGNLTHAFITCEVAAVRFWLDGTAPTATVGHNLEVGDTLELESEPQLQNVRFIRRDGVDSTLRCSYGA